MKAIWCAYSAGYTAQDGLVHRLPRTNPDSCIKTVGPAEQLLAYACRVITNTRRHLSLLATISTGPNHIRPQLIHCLVHLALAHLIVASQLLIPSTDL